MSSYLEGYDEDTWSVFSMAEKMPDDIAGLAQAVKEHAPGSATAAGTAVDHGYEDACETLLVASRNLLANPSEELERKLATQAQTFKAEAFRVMRDLLNAGDDTGFMLHCMYSQRYLNEALWAAADALELSVGRSFPPALNLWDDARPSWRRSSRT